MSSGSNLISGDQQQRVISTYMGSIEINVMTFVLENECFLSYGSF